MEWLEQRQVLAATAISAVTSPNSFNHFKFNTGTSTFDAPINNTTLFSAAQNEVIAMGDVNADGYEDVVRFTGGHLISFGFFSAPGSLSVSLGSSTGVFGGYGTWDANIPLSANSGSSTWTDMKVGDFTGDGKADVLMRNKDTGEWNQWASTGTTFTKSVFGTWDIGIQWRDAMVGDFNADGKMDLIGRRAVTIPTTGVLDQWYVGRGSATTINRGTVGVAGNTWWNLTSGNSTSVLANAVVGDFNGDAKDDLAMRFLDATAADGSRMSSWLVATTAANGAFVSTTAAWTGWAHSTAGGVQKNWTDIQSGDVNGDFKDDIIGRDVNGKWLMAAGGTSLVTAATQVADWSAASYKNNTVVAGDFNNDKKLDLVVRNTSDNQWYRAQFTGSSFSTPVAAGGMGFIGNPNRKITFVNGSAAGYATYLGHRGDLGSVDALALLEDVHGFKTGGTYAGYDPYFTVGHFLSDGSFDFENFGGGVISPTPSIGPNGGANFRADFTGDGLQDILVQGLDPNAVGKWYLAKHIGNAFVNSPITNIPQSWAGPSRQMKVADFTGDGKSDFLVMVQDTTTTAHWELYVSTGTGFANAVTVATMTSTTNDGWLTGGAIGDFDGDGKDDFTYEIRTIANPNVYKIYVAYSNGTSTWTIAAPWSRTDSTAIGATRLFFIENQGERVRVGNINGDVNSVTGLPIDDVLGLQNLNGSPTSTGQVWAGFSSATRGVSGGTTTLNLPAAFDFNAPKDRHVFEVGRFVNLDNLADIMINPSDNTNLIRVYRSTGTGFFATPAFSGAIGPYGLLRPLVSDVDRDGYDDLVWQSTGYAFSLMARSALPTNICNVTGFIPSFIAYWDGDATTIPRLRRRRG